MARKIVASILAALLAGGGLAACQQSGSKGTQEPAAGAGPVAGQGAARLLLNEVVFLPTAGQPQWVELINVGGETASLDGIQIENPAGAKFAIPAGQRLSAGAVRVVRFDGQSAVDGSAIHASPAAFLGPAGFVQLDGATGVLDRIAWGSDQPGAARLSRGGYQADPAPGMSVGRVPRTVTSNPLDWVSYKPDQTTEGRANPQPAVAVLLPMNGAIVTPDNTSLNWYPAPGAARYRVQLAADRSFGAVLFDQTVDQPVVTPTLQPGSYVWRVQAIAANGTAAEYSPLTSLTVRARRTRAGRGRALLEWLLPHVHAQTASPNGDAEIPMVLGVPLIKQHKDTRMLIIESSHEGDHGWDSDHGDLSPLDPADTGNCAPASIAMLTAFYGGRLSQDRINYELLKNYQRGPQGDLNWDLGMNDPQIARALKFALGREPVVEHPSDELSAGTIAAIRIEHGIPMVLCKGDHCVVVVGATSAVVGAMVVNDPWRGVYEEPMHELLGATVFAMADDDGITKVAIHARSDEPEVSRDSDGDDVVDFDEIYRFQTDPHGKDTDHDELPDKEDIKASVLDPRHGFAFFGNGRDFDGDGKMMELDDDSDDGGCLDGWEDVNKNGEYERDRKEMDFFLKADDPCITGTMDLKNDEEWEVSGPVHTTNALSGLTHYSISLRPLDAERWEGKATVALDSWSTTTTVTPSGRCEERTTTEQKPHFLWLTGNGRASPDGRIDINLRLKPGARSPPIHLAWRKSCSTPESGAVDTTTGAAAWPWPHFTLVKGVYDENTVRATPPRAGASGSGKWITKVHLEQKRAQPQGARE